MPLVDVELEFGESDMPDDVADFLADADARINEFVEQSPVQLTGFVPSDFVAVYHALRVIAERNLATGASFCEWGSGFGVVASLAAMLKFTVCGIEIEKNLVDSSCLLASDYDLPVQFVQGSFVPAGAEAATEEAYVENSSDVFWLVTNADDAYSELGLEPDDFDVVFAYPWPGEGHVIARLFEQTCANGALLLTQESQSDLRLRRKLPRRASR